MTRLQRRIDARRPQRPLDLRNPIARATLRQQIQRDVEALLTSAGLHTLMGGDKSLILYKLGWLYWCTLGGAVRSNIDTDHPDISILRGACNLLGDLQESPSTEVSATNRASLMSAVSACQRLHVQISEYDTMRAAAKLVALLANGGNMGTADIDGLFKTAEGVQS